MGTELQYISHVYRGLILNGRAFASFKKEELDVIYKDLSIYLSENDVIFDPMSGYGGCMFYFGEKGHRTFNVEINPPEYYWQVLNNPQNHDSVMAIIDKMLNGGVRLPVLKEEYSVIDGLFSDSALEHVKKLFEVFMSKSNDDKEISTAMLLPFVSRFANYVRSTTNITHFKEGGFCSYSGWESDFNDYLGKLKTTLNKNFNSFKQNEHHVILSDIFKVDIKEKYKFFVTSPPYPNYRDYSKIFKIENFILNNVIYEAKTDFGKMIGSNNVSKKKYGTIDSECANKFLKELLEKAEKLKKERKKACSDIITYYHPYFSQYFYNIQEAYKKIDTFLSNDAVGYLVVNDNITRDIVVPVGESIREMFVSMGYGAIDIDTSRISHYGNIGKSATRMNSKHTRHIIKVWKK